MDQGTPFVGLDVHKRSISVAVREAGTCGVQEERLPNERGAIARWARRWKRRSGGRLVCAYEAGACGYALQRQLEALGIECRVVAPSLVPRRPGERIKTARRDACKLVEYLESGHLTVVRPPTPAEEAARDLCRAREDAKQDRMRARHRLLKFLLRRGHTYAAGRKHWTQAHRAWLESLHFETAEGQAVFEDYRLALAQVEGRIEALDRKLEALAQQPAYRAAVGALRCFRGIDTRTAIGLVADEDSSGERKRRGPITKAGNGHARRLLLEAAWHARHKPSLPRALRERREGQPPEIVAMADEAQKWLHRRYWRLVQRGKPPTVAATAAARELTGFVWAALRTVS